MTGHKLTWELPPILSTNKHRNQLSDSQRSDLSAEGQQPRQQQPRMETALDPNKTMGPFKVEIHSFHSNI